MKQFNQKRVRIRGAGVPSSLGRKRTPPLPFFPQLPLWRQQVSGSTPPRAAAGHFLGRWHCCLTHGRAPRTLRAVCTNPWKFMFHSTRSELFNVSITEGGECASHQEVSGRICHWQSIDQPKIHAKAFHGNMQSINTKETQKWGIWFETLEKEQ